MALSKSPFKNITTMASVSHKASLYKSPALGKIQAVLFEIAQQGQDMAQSVNKLCSVLLENIAVPTSAPLDSAFGKSFAFKTHLALIQYINRYLLQTTRERRTIVTMLTKALILKIRERQNDIVEKNKYLLLLWILKFPLIEHAVRRKMIQYKEDLYQGSFAILLRCIERCNPERAESFDAYFAKALFWNIPRLFWQIKNEKEILMDDRGMDQNRERTEIISDSSAHSPAEGKEEKKEILDNLLREWWHKAKSGVALLTGKTEFTLATIQETFFILQTARQKKSNLWEHARVNDLLAARASHPSVEEPVEFIRTITLIYITYCLLKQGKKQAQIGRELQLSRERIRQYVQFWIKPHLKSKTGNISLSTARHVVVKSYQHAKKQLRQARALLLKFFTADQSLTPPPLLTKVTPNRNIKLFKLNIRFPKKIVVQGQVVRITAEVYGKENRLIFRTFSHNERIGWCLVHWDAKQQRLVSSTNKTTVTVIPFTLPETQLQNQIYRHFVKAVRRGIAVDPPETKLKIKTAVKYPYIATTIFGKSSPLFLNLTNTSYLMSIIGVQVDGAEKSLLAKFEAVEKEGHVEYKHITLAGKDLWHYRALAAKKDANGKVQFYHPREKNVPVRFQYEFDEATR